MTTEVDEVRCDRCGLPTVQLDPPTEPELCERCYWLARAAREQRRSPARQEAQR